MFVDEDGQVRVETYRPGLDDRAQYLFGLDCIFDGVGAMLDRGGSTCRDRSGPPRKPRCGTDE